MSYQLEELASHITAVRQTRRENDTNSPKGKITGYLDNGHPPTIHTIVCFLPENGDTEVRLRIAAFRNPTRVIEEIEDQFRSPSTSKNSRIEQIASAAIRIFSKKNEPKSKPIPRSAVA